VATLTEALKEAAWFLAQFGFRPGDNVPQAFAGHVVAEFVASRPARVGNYYQLRSAELNDAGRLRIEVAIPFSARDIDPNVELWQLWERLRSE